VTEVDQRARRLVIAYAILLDALEQAYPDERDCYLDLSHDHFNFPSAYDYWTRGAYLLFWPLWSGA
jgi:hypothetical protein